MSKEPKLYTRLTRNAAGVGSYSSLWLAADHLMLVKSTGYNESYSRIQLRDIKAILLTQSDRRMLWALLWGIIALWGGLVMGSSLIDRQTPVFSAIFFTLGAIGLVWNQQLGPGCRAYVVTGVQVAPLASLVRMKQARRVLAKLQPLIETSQADLAAVAAAETAGTHVATPVIAAPPVIEEKPTTG